uniref:Metastasis suppressor 1 n=1 Tax=Gongylonema pulchrum TaxID=637853 RepID=A0A183EX30_9BILA
LPTYQVVRSPASKIGSSPMSHMSLSVPPVDSVGSSVRHSSDSRNKTPILLDHDGFNYMTSTDSSGKFCCLTLFELSRP